MENWRNNYTYSWAAQRLRARRERIIETLAVLASFAMAAGMAAIIVVVLSR